MRTWLTVTLAAVAAILLVVAAAVLIVQEDENGPDPEDRFPQTPDEEPEEDEPGRESDGSIEVTEAWLDEGDCITIAEEEDVETEDERQQTEEGQAQEDQEDVQENETDQETCHRIRVTATASADNPFLVGVGLWQAEDDRGELHNASWVRSPDPLDAGGTRSVVVSFDASDDVRMLTLRYADPGGPSISARVGPYEDDMTQEEVARAR